MVVLSSRSTPVRAVPARSRWFVGVAPGLACCLAVALAAGAFQSLEARLFGHVWIESLVLAIVVGAAVRTLWTPAASVQLGIGFGAKTLLEIAVMLLGASVSAAALMSVGWALLSGVVVIVMLSIGVSLAIGRALRLPSRVALLVACGNSICGNSAIAAVAPVIGADSEDVIAAIAFTAALGVAAVLGLPALGAWLHLSSVKYGVLSGLTVYAVPQVLAAAAPAGTLAVQVGAMVKLVRVLMLGPVCFLASVLTRHGLAPSPSPGGPLGSKVRVRTPVAPWFIVGFLSLAALRSIGVLPSPIIGPVSSASRVLTVVSMAALGLCTDLRSVARSGPRVAAAATLSLLSLGAMSLGLILLIWG